MMEAGKRNGARRCMKRPPTLMLLAAALPIVNAWAADSESLRVTKVEVTALRLWASGLVQYAL